jgi:hypothetical protein
MGSSLGFGNLFWQAVWFGHPVYRKSKCWKRTDGFAQWDGMGWEWRCLWSPRMRSLGRLMAAGRSFLSVFAHLSIRTKVLFSDDTKNHNILVIYFTYSRPRHALCPLFLKATITPCRSKMLDLPRSISDDTLQESLRTVSSIHHVSYYTTTHQLLNFHSTLTVAFAACPV